MKRHSQDEPGFTIVEIVVVVAVMLVISIGLFSTMFNFSLGAKGDQGKIDIAYDKQVAITTVETDVQTSSNFLPTRDSSMNDPYETFSMCGNIPAPSGCTGTSWNASGNGSACTWNAPASLCVNNTQNTYAATNKARVLILQEYATTTNPYDTNRLPVYLGVNGNSQCNAVSKDLNPILTYNVIYFIQNETLYRRRLVNSTIPNDGSQTCGDIFNQKLSCPSIETLQAAGINSRNASCGADDEVIATSVASMNYAVYADCAGASVTVFAGTGSTNPTDPNIKLAKCVNVDIILSRASTTDNTIQGEAELRMSSLNVGGLN